MKNFLDNKNFLNTRQQILEKIVIMYSK